MKGKRRKVIPYQCAITRVTDLEEKSPIRENVNRYYKIPFVVVTMQSKCKCPAMILSFGLAAFVVSIYVCEAQKRSLDAT